MERRTSTVVSLVRVGAAFDEEFDDVYEAGGDSDVERRASPHVDVVHIASLVNEVLKSFYTVNSSGIMKGV